MDFESGSSSGGTADNSSTRELTEICCPIVATFIEDEKAILSKKKNNYAKTCSSFTSSMAPVSVHVWWNREALPCSHAS